MATRRAALLALPSLVAMGSTRAAERKRFGYLALGSDSDTPRPQRPLYVALRRKGWIVGDNLLPVPAYANGKAERLRGLAEELVRNHVDVVLSDGAPATLAIARATHAIPIVFTSVPFPVEQGLIDSFARPGHNVTGVSWDASIGVGLKRFEFLRQVAPAAKRLSGIWDEDTLSGETASGGRFDLSASFFASLNDLGYATLQPYFIAAVRDIDAAFAEIIVWRADALSAIGAIAFAARQRIAEFCLRQRLASTFGQRENVEAGGLLSYGPAPDPQLLNRLVDMIDRVLRGVSPTEIPVEQPSRYELVINAGTAKALGLTIPPALLARADEVIR